MKILTFVNISNIDDIESDSGYIFNYLLAQEFSKKHKYKVVLPELLKKKTTTKFDADSIYYAKIGVTKYQARYSFDWDNICEIIRHYSPDIIFLNQCELASAMKSLLLTISMKKIKVVTYCHYPALHYSDNDVILDYSLNDAGLCENILMNILSSINVSDAFITQSDFSKTMILKFADKYNYYLNKSIDIVCPPFDPFLLNREIDLERKKSKKILYNHRLYASYGTEKFLNFVSNHPNLMFSVSDPMPNRNKNNIRKKFNNTPLQYKEKLSTLKNVEIFNGGENRHLYKKILEDSYIAIAPYREACVWSMSVIDCFCLGIPVVAPNFAAYKEFIWSDLLYNDDKQFNDLVIKLLNNKTFYKKAVETSYAFLDNITPSKIANKILKCLEK